MSQILETVLCFFGRNFLQSDKSKRILNRQHFGFKNLQNGAEFQKNIKKQEIKKGDQRQEKILESNKLPKSMPNHKFFEEKLQFEENQKLNGKKRIKKQAKNKNKCEDIFRITFSFLQNFNLQPQFVIFYSSLWNHLVNIIPIKDQTVSMASYTFVLDPIYPSCHYSKISVDFTPLPNPNRSSNSIVPAFLNDRKCYTPAFVLSRDQEYFRNTLSFEKDRFDERVLKEQALHKQLESCETTEALITLPMPSSTYCQICRTHFSLYNEHVQDASHLRQSRFSKANTYIKQLSNKLKKRNPSKAPKKPKKLISKRQPKVEKAKKATSNTNNKSKRKSGNLIKGNNLSTNAPSGIPTSF